MFNILFGKIASNILFTQANIQHSFINLKHSHNIFLQSPNPTAKNQFYHTLKHQAVIFIYECSGIFAVFLKSVK
jgi:hypothetical protein